MRPRLRRAHCGIWRSATEGRAAARRPWSVAILSAHPLGEITNPQPSWRQSKRQVPFVCSRSGSWIAASVEIAGADQLTAVALYGLMDELSDASVHRSLCDLGPVLDATPRYRRRVLLGDDLNSGTAWLVNEPFLARGLNLLQRFEALGPVDCLARMRGTARAAPARSATPARTPAQGGIRAGPMSHTRPTISGPRRYWPSARFRVRPSLARTGSPSRITPRSSASSTRARRRMLGNVSRRHDKTARTIETDSRFPGATALTTARRRRARYVERLSRALWRSIQSASSASLSSVADSLHLTEIHATHETADWPPTRSAKPAWTSAKPAWTSGRRVERMPTCRGSAISASHAGGWPPVGDSKHPSRRRRRRANAAPRTANGGGPQLDRRLRRRRPTRSEGQAPWAPRAGQLRLVAAVIAASSWRDARAPLK